MYLEETERKKVVIFSPTPRGLEKFDRDDADIYRIDGPFLF